jgi:pseudouridine kinase
MSVGTVVIGTVFMDCKGFARYRYDPLGRNVGAVKFIHGGVGRNVAENLAKLGQKTAFVASVDDNALGRDIVKNLNDLGVDVSGMVKTENSGMGVWLAVMDEKGALSASISQMPDLGILEKLVDERGDELVSQAGSVALEIDLTDDISSKVLKLAEKHGKPVYGIVGNMEVVLRNRDFLRRMACFICNDVEAGRLFGANVSRLEPDDALELLIRESSVLKLPPMVVTLGERGCIYYDPQTDEKGKRAAIPTKVVDSSGAGDAFFSGALFGLTRGETLSRAVDYGTQLASLTIQVENPTCSFRPEDVVRR